MQINPIQQNTNFTARYRVLLTKSEFEDFKEHVLPALDKIHDGEVDYLYGKSPSEYEFALALDDYANANSSNVDWAIQNVSNSGSLVSKSDGAILWLTTGKKDTKLFAKFDEKCEKLFRLRCEIAGFKLIGSEYEDELFTLKAIEQALGKESKDFFKFIKKHPFKKMKNIDEIVKAEQQNLNIVL